MVRVQSFTEAGGHPQNEDAFVVEQHQFDQNLWICFVADGQGGRAGGGAAARVACQSAINAASNALPERLSEPTTWRGIFRSADNAVGEASTAGFTTLVGLAVDGERVIGASSGDSAALMVGIEKVVELTSRQIKNPPVGSGAAVAVPFATTLEKGWQLLVMTDGVWKYVGWNRLVSAAHKERGVALIDDLKRLARLPVSGEFSDDFTIVLLEADEEMQLASGAA